MVFEGSNSPLSGIPAVDMGRYQLKGAIIASDGLLECSTDFIVKNVQCRGHMAGCESGIGCLIRCDSVGVVFGCKWLDEDGIGW